MITYEDGYEDGRKSRDDEIARLKKILEMKDSLDEFRTLEKKNEELTERVKELEAELELTRGEIDTQEKFESFAKATSTIMRAAKCSELEKANREQMRLVSEARDALNERNIALTEAQGRIERAIEYKNKSCSGFLFCVGIQDRLEQILKGEK